MAASVSPARDRLLDAAEEVALLSGATGLTLDAVAAQASVSKGGLLYHFPTKDALISAIVERLTTRFHQRVTAAFNADPDPGRPGSFTRAFIKASRACLDSTDVKVGGSLLAALAGNPSLLEPLRTSYQSSMAILHDDGLPPGASMTIAAALDGLLLWNLFRLWEPAQDQLRKMLTFIEMLADFPE